MVAQGAQLKGDSVAFAATRGDANIEGKLAQVTNGGSLTTAIVSGVTVASTTYDATASGWLKVTVLKSATPATLLIEPQIVGLTSGLHTARITVTAPGATSTTVPVTIDVAPLPPVALVVVTQPQAGKKTEPLIVNPVVELRDALGLLATQSADTVTARVQFGTGTLTGQTSIIAVNGVARFTNLKLSDAGTFALLFESTGGVMSTTSLNFAVTASAKLVATVAPTTVTSGALITPPIEISTLDFTTQLVTNEVNLVTVTIAGVDGAVGALNGSTTVATSGGKAIFTDLRVNGQGVFDLTFSAPGLTSAVVRVTLP